MIPNAVCALVTFSKVLERDRTNKASEENQDRSGHIIVKIGKKIKKRRENLLKFLVTQT